MSSTTATSTSWPDGNRTVPAAHICNCIGCCPDCGTCRTSPAHTRDYCELLQKQRHERELFFEACADGRVP